MTCIRSLYFWILMAFLGGCLFGLLNPQAALLMEPLGTNFVKLIKLFIGPIVFLTVAAGIAQTGSIKKLGKTGLKAFIYFESVSTIALIIGWAAASLVKPGASIHANLHALDAQSVQRFLASAEKLSFTDFIQNIIPASILEPFIKGDTLQILFISIIVGIALLALDDKTAKNCAAVLEQLSDLFFQAIRIVLYAAPLGVFGSMSYTIAKFGGHFLIPLLGLIGTFYLAGGIFVFLVLGLIAKLSGFSLLGFLKYLAPELILVLGTSSSEPFLPQLMRKLEALGCQKETVGVVVPMGYSFNLDGTNIYITLSALFIAQALGIHLSFTQEFTLFATAMLSSKGAAGVTGAGFVTLAATLAVVPSIPAVGIVLILGIDRFMSEARALINYFGNGVACLVISRSENEMSAKNLNRAIEKNSIGEFENPVITH